MHSYLVAITRTVHKREAPKSSDKEKHKKCYQHDRSNVLVDFSAPYKLPLDIIGLRNLRFFGEKKEERIVERDPCACVCIL
jgi:hypothetical protein